MAGRVQLLETWIDQVDLGEAGERIAAYVEAGGAHQIMTANLDFLRLGCQERAFQELLNMADLVVADGMPLVWASRLGDQPLPGRVAGVDLVAECARLSAQKGYRLFLLGAGAGVAERAAAVLQARYPELVLAGTYAPAGTSPAEDAVTIERVRAAAPDILLVAFGAPRQDYWIRQHRERLGVPVCIGVGGSFDLLSGRISRAPSWMQRSGLEWLYRFGREPARLWKRYFVHDLPVFLRLMLTTGVRSMAAPFGSGMGTQAKDAAAIWAPTHMARADVPHHTLHG